LIGFFVIGDELVRHMGRSSAIVGAVMAQLLGRSGKAFVFCAGNRP
jgi:hypothetical protein